MITVTMHTNHKGLYDGFHIEGHADGFEKDGEYDLICASVSAITLTIAAGLRDVLHMEGTFDSDFGYMDVHLDSPGDSRGQALIETMVNGLQQIDGEFHVTFQSSVIRS